MRRKNKILRSDLPDSIKKKCNTIIHTASVAAGGVGTGLAQLPLVDNAVIMPIQITMIISLGKVFGQEITESAAKAIISGAAASFVGRGVSQALWGWIPGLGNVINTATAAGLTEAIGWMAVDNFSKDVNYDDVIIKDNEPNVSSERTGKEGEEKKEMVQELKKRAMEFLDGVKNRKENRDEFQRLLKDMEDTMDTLDDEELKKELKDMYDKL